jgi:hypothetical protein
MTGILPGGGRFGKIADPEFQSPISNDRQVGKISNCGTTTRLMRIELEQLSTTRKAETLGHGNAAVRDYYGRLAQLGFDGASG